ncbi:MAG: hypothetical protein A3F79_05405 [Chlamydiae bacterium RIFCSPLOWO2_12_FULL_45_20]|nr:MAG: hypothetical protein A3I67_01330 [Chlamydiae bacterium RIFCSPLOWO2_02_FULL_45_22]OGN71005.1 MAG: hypothetical protein A3F79_05405 [Chlamydiae bacterium RIFCSPLOWO2_12_FULL_45_20]
MLKMALDHIPRRDPRKMVIAGLAAPQIGIAKRIIVIDEAAPGALAKITVMINPEILWQSEERQYDQESCDSTSKFIGIVPRSTSIFVKYYDREGNIFTVEHSGYAARVIQHEVDHLNGIRFPERIGEQGVLHWVEEGDIPEYGLNWQNWPSCSWDDWLEVRDGCR